MNRFCKILHEGKTFWCREIDGSYFPLLESIFKKAPRVASNPLICEKPCFLPPFEGQMVFALAYNYKSLVGDKDLYDEPLIFFKAPSSVVAHQGVVHYPEFSKKVWIEAELTIVIGKKTKNVPVAEADEYILGYTCGNDITAENILGRDWHLARSKGLDTFCPLGPYLVREVDTSDLRISSFINGKMTQDSRTSDRVLNDRESVALVSKYFTLSPGDIILTGTPKGATDAVVKPGDQVRIEIENIGILINNIK
jgi:2-keto-4-pentenoate hydratase/2-oxohepta-3-ene-1,7-dioic acid hydratase in catechol pathway